MNTPDRLFLGWHRPAIQLVAERLLTLNSTQPELFRRMIVVVPTRESGRRLRELMASKAPQGALLMPRIIQPSRILDLPQLPIASPLELQAAWLQILNAETVSAEYPNLFPTAPNTLRAEEWSLAVSQQMMQLSQGLENDMVTPQEICCRMAGDLSATLGERADEELDRWKDIAKLISRVEEQLHRWGRISRGEAIQQALSKLCWPGRTRLMVLACLPQLPPYLQQGISALHGLDGGRVEAWIHAPAEMEEHFTDFGIPNAWWEQCTIELKDEQIHVTAQQEALAEQSLRCLEGCSSDQAVLGACDADFIPALVRRFGEQNWPLYDPRGRNVGPMQLAALPAQLAEAAIPDDKASSLESLMRNPVLMRLYGIRHQEFCCAHLDTINQTYFPSQGTALLHYLEKAAEEAQSKGEATADAKSAVYLFARQLATLARDLNRPEKLPATLSSLADRLTAAYTTTAPYNRCANELAQLLRETAAFITNKPTLCTASAALNLISHIFSRTRLQPIMRSNCALDVLGWLELPYAEGEHLVITGLHEGCVPVSRGANIFLPDSISHTLGLQNSHTELARDSYILTSLLQSHKKTDIIVARVNPEHAPLIPSSLLLRCPQKPHTLLPERVTKLFASMDVPIPSPSYNPGIWHLHGSHWTGPPKPTPQASPTAIKGVPPTQPLPAVPSPVAAEKFPPEPITLLTDNPKNRWADPERYLSPSALSAFLRCPLRFWLNNVLHLNPDDAYLEDKSAYDNRDRGTLTHAVLCRLTKEYNTYRDDLRAEDIAARAAELLDEEIAQSFSEPLSVSFAAQAEQIKRTLNKFAYAHLDDLQNGWSVILREEKVDWDTGTGMKLRMTLDRVDQHQDGRIRVIDYKTGKTKPNEAHLQECSAPERYRQLMGELRLSGKSAWINVQLPLYAQYAATHISHGAPVEVAYYNIILNEETVEYSSWDLTQDLLNDALLVAQEAARMIHAGTCLIPAEVLGFAAYGNFGALAPNGDLRAMLKLPPLPEIPAPTAETSHA